MMLFAVHIADGLLAAPWWLGGFALAAAVLAWAGWRLPHEEVPRIGLFTAAFFVASQIHIPLGAVKVHLLLNGLVGVVLRRRTGLALAVGLTFQAVLFGHGGFSTLGVNFLVQWIPATLGAWLVPRLLRRWKPFAVGVTCGAITALLTVLLNAAVLALGGIADFSAVAVVSFLAHLPVVAVEAVLVGSVLQVLVRAKPEWFELRPVAAVGAG